MHPMMPCTLSLHGFSNVCFCYMHRLCTCNNEWWKAGAEQRRWRLQDQLSSIGCVDGDILVGQVAAPGHAPAGPAADCDLSGGGVGAGRRMVSASEAGRYIRASLCAAARPMLRSEKRHICTSKRVVTGCRSISHHPTPPTPTTHLDVDGAVHVRPALEVGGGRLLVKGQRLAFVHQHNVSQHDAHRVLVVLHPRVAAAGAAGVGWGKGGGQREVVGMRWSACNQPSTACVHLEHAARSSMHPSTPLRSPRRGGDAAPVGVMPKDGRLGQAGAHYALGHLRGGAGGRARGIAAC